ncbi:MAG: hypothetical protein RLZZ598_285 [Pseudomonadota bacterium]|jgi:predicted lipid-binding transport protein (Tim44 family)
MKSWLIALSLALGAAMSLAPIHAEAKRLGGGKSAGMQRQASPAKPAESPTTTPAQSAQPAQPVPPSNATAPAGAAAAGAATPGKRSWMAPLAGIAAGLGIAALMSHFGMGEAFGNFLVVLLLVGVAFFAIRWLMGRMSGSSNAGPQLAGAGAAAGAAAPSVDLRPHPGAETLPHPAPEPVPSPSAAVATRPEGFDAEAFERSAKLIFIRMQAANDAGAVEDLRKFTTPELFASLRLDLQDRHGAAQQTDVLQLEAKVVDTAQEDGQWVATVRFRGLIREQSESAAAPFDELWHLVRPLDNSREWAIAGITQST